VPGFEPSGRTGLRSELSAEDWPIRGSVCEELLATEGGNLLAEILPSWLTGEIMPQAQDETIATYTKKFADTDAHIDFDSAQPLRGEAACAALLKIRAFDKSPRAHFFLPSKAGGHQSRIIITDATIENDMLKLLTIIPEGKREMPYADFIRSQKKV